MTTAPLYELRTYDPDYGWRRSPCHLDRGPVTWAHGVKLFRYALEHSGSTCGRTLIQVSK